MRAEGEWDKGVIGGGTSFYNAEKRLNSKMMKMKIKAILMIVLVLIGICIIAPMINAETAEEWTVIGMGFSLSGDYEKAIGCFNMAIVMYPNAAEAYYWRGLAYYDLSQYKLAIEDFDKAVALDPTNVDADHNREVATSKLEEKPPIPGFETIFAITGFLAVAYLFIGRKSG